MPRSVAPPSDSMAVRAAVSPLEASQGGWADDNVVQLRGGGAVVPGEVPAAPPSVQLNLLGGFELLIDGRPVEVGSSGQRVLVAIACRGRQVTRSQIARQLWPDVSDERALANLRTALYRLGRRAPLAISAINSYLQLPVGMQIDLERTTKLANRIVGASIIYDEKLLEDLLTADFTDDLLPDWDEEWVEDHRYRFRQLRLTALEKLSDHYATIGHYGAAVQAALTAVQADSLRDSAHESLIRAYLAEGNRREAFAHFATYRRLLRDELGIDPPAAIGRLLTTA